MDFGDYCTIEQKRYGCDNEMYVHKVINTLDSNGYVDVPVQSPATETLHSKIVPVVSCICCGVDETVVLKYRVCDVTPAGKKNNSESPENDLTTKQGRLEDSAKILPYIEDAICLLENSQDGHALELLIKARAKPLPC